MRVALCQIDTRQADLRGNARSILDSVSRAHDLGAEVALLPELALCGYCPRDLLLRSSFLNAIQVEEDRLAARFPAGIQVVFGSVTQNPDPAGRRLFNAALLASDGRIEARRAKRLIPNYDVFDEARYFTPGRDQTPVELGRRACGLTVCEDLWFDCDHSVEMPAYPADPASDLVGQGAEWIANISASPFQLGKTAYREELVRNLARKHEVPVALVNLVGGNDEILFDGHSFAVDASGEVIARAKGMQEDLVVFELDDRGTTPGLENCDPHDPAELDRVFDGLVMGVRDYATKTGFAHALLGLSGGIDSTVVAAIAARALGPDKVLGVAMPSRYSASISLEDARILAERLGIRFEVIPIGPAFDLVLSELDPHLGESGAGVTEENLQPRIRGLYLMALSNKHGSLLLTTGNKSELAVGYCTLYGDMCGGLAVISDLPKTLVYSLARRINERFGDPIPERCISRAPSAELRPDQKDSDSLPPYEILDDILRRSVEMGESVVEIVAAGHDGETVRGVLDRLWKNEYKRKQMPPGLRVTPKAFGIGRRMPITSGAVWFDQL